MIATLIPLDGSAPIHIVRDVTVVGRKQGLCDLIFDHESISKMHCVIARTDGLLFFRDLGSTNGTRVNGQRVVRGALLPNDELAFAALKFRSFVILLLASWLPFVARGVQIYLSSSFQQVSVLAATTQTFRDFLDQQGLFVFLVTIALGGAIADDRRANALQLYLSKPLTRTEYIIGRLAPVLALSLIHI